MRTPDDLYDDASQMVDDALNGKHVDPKKLEMAVKLMQTIFISIYFRRRDEEFIFESEDKEP